MTRFEDGPAKGQTLMLKRAPFLLRVTRKKLLGDVLFDALDQLTDEPTPDEELFAYELTARPGWSFVDGSKTRGLYAIGLYKLCEPQPSDEEMRSNSAWSAWCNTEENQFRYNQLKVG